MAMEQQQPLEDFRVAAVSANIPKFWKADVENWFVFTEIQFNEARITTEATKFSKTVSALDDTVIRSLDLAMLQKSDEPYTQLKRKLIHRYAVSSETKLTTLLAGVSLADQRPTEFLERLRNLAGGNATELMLRAMFMQQMPTSVRRVLLACKEELDELAKIADTIIETCGAEIAAVHSDQRVESGKTYSSGERSQFRGRGRGRTSGRGTHNARTGHVCYFHNTYGSKAQKCDMESCLLRHLLKEN